MLPDNPVSLLSQLISTLKEISGDQYVFTDAASLEEYGKDQTLDFSYAFDVLIKPGSANEIARVMRTCGQLGIPVTPRGGGSGVTGGALPVYGGVVLSMERLNRILEINELDGYVVAETGVVTADLVKEVTQHNMYLPVVPSSSAFSLVGGNVAENAGSISSCKYGSTGDYVLNLEVVLPTGEIIWTGANVAKNSTGFNLTRLFVGSEGVLGIITKVVYRLLRQPLKDASLLAGFNSLDDAFEALLAIRRSPLQPSATELICDSALQITAAYLGEPQPLVKPGIHAHLLVSLQHATEDGLMQDLQQAATLMEKYTQEDILTGMSAAEKERLWKLRYTIGTALTHGQRYYRDIDICVPLSVLHGFILKAEMTGKQYGVPVVCFGHALDGNMHTMLLFDEMIRDNNGLIDRIVEEIYSWALAHGGVISGEHGIGLLQKSLMHLQFSETHIRLMQQIKSVFDPLGMLNPGKII
jgi:glycolate oxidase